MKQILTIAGSDSGGGAGIQADIKSIAANGAYAMTAITSITAQNTTGVTAVYDLPLSIIEAQLQAIFDDFDVAAVKTGMLSSADIVQLVGRTLATRQVPFLVVDPVMVAKSGQALLKPEAVDRLISVLLPLAYVVTPNIPEAERLAGMTITTIAEARQAAKIIHKLGCRHVLIKGGHLLAERGTDLLYDGKFFNVYKGAFIDTPHTHGTGCTYASAIAAQLARGKALPDAVQTAKTYITEAIRHGLAMGHGKGPTNHFYFLPDSA
jgi:hydroxymethylpyrimidine/phosphomethylpyrimidine kinase